MTQGSDSIATIKSEDLEFLQEADDSSISSTLSSPFSCIGLNTNSFFKRSKSNLVFPDSYSRLWSRVEENSNIRRIKALLLDYTKENFLLGSSIGLIISGHWNRHHVSAVSKIIANISVKNYYESADDVVADLKTLKPEIGGSLYQRIKFIEMKLEEHLKYYFNY
ncbi:DUF5617 domain-containing protein [Legionella longbeachae]|uniref:RavJ-like C-terminal domain-containing protein n=1 Tax=Legionella longbeachae serogroup 1 (strain NSW150) TaxID=661367 RepID=D3HKM3_LEGLN|nr:DUF5617 domain-containing protein [Legionella longbeachae]VEE03506.1 Dot/Icm secretion system substrate [Legionella oakridgensis]HBD7397783.1 DUF5617 domain-containing protein [Legionella pneumophila]ARB93602.1 hypothetical protein A6J40_16125 [Legionella longbeachae]ARM33257.1 hypothetical protein B0B39_06845 [Legionella longbeachae]EEZ93883.1 hypothetical protein LLB_2780 [Legionella longbeachae D-4968]